RQFHDGSLRTLQFNAFHNGVDHVMDNYTLRDPNPLGPMPMPMAANVERRTDGGRMAAEWEWNNIVLTAGMDAQLSRHRQRRSMGDAYKDMLWEGDAELRNSGAFAEGKWTFAENQHVIAGARLDRARTTDLRTVAGMADAPNPTFGQNRRDTLPAAFLRYERAIA